MGILDFLGSIITQISYYTYLLLDAIITVFKELAKIIELMYNLVDVLPVFMQATTMVGIGVLVAITTYKLIRKG